MQFFDQRPPEALGHVPVCLSYKSTLVFLVSLLVKMLDIKFYAKYQVE